MNYEKYIDLLVTELTGRYPLNREKEYHRTIKFHRAIRESIKEVLRPVGWSKDREDVREYLIDPLGERIPYVWADMLFAEDPFISAAAKADQERMDDLINSNELPSELHRAEWLCSSEGEVWWRVVPDELSMHACIEWHSRLVVTPLWVGKYLMAAAFVSELSNPDPKSKAVYRYVEVHTKGYVRRLLYIGAPDTDNLGQEVDLARHPVTADWTRDWDHGLDMMCGRIVNKLGADKHMGVSDYDGIEDLLLALNEATTVGQENMRLTAKQRAILPQRFLDQQGNLPRGSEILIATEVDQDPEKIKNQVAMVEFEFDATALISWLEHSTDVILTRARVAPQLVGRHTEGAQTGPALRARILDSVLAAAGKGKFWDDSVPQILLLSVQVENLPTGKGGLGVGWSNTTKLPSFKRANALPEDPESLSRRLAIEVNAEFLSRKTAIAMSHPEWDDKRVEDEVKQIMEEVGNAAEAPTAAFGKDASTTNPPQAPGAIPVRSNQPPRPEMGGTKGERRDGGVRARA